MLLGVRACRRNQHEASPNRDQHLPQTACHKHVTVFNTSHKHIQHLRMPCEARHRFLLGMALVAAHPVHHHLFDRSPCEAPRNLQGAHALRASMFPGSEGAAVGTLARWRAGSSFPSSGETLLCRVIVAVEWRRVS